MAYSCMESCCLVSLSKVICYCWAQKRHNVWFIVGFLNSENSARIAGILLSRLSQLFLKCIDTQHTYNMLAFILHWYAHTCTHFPCSILEQYCSVAPIGCLSRTHQPKKVQWAGWQYSRHAVWCLLECWIINSFCYSLKTSANTKPFPSNALYKYITASKNCNQEEHDMLLCN